MTTEMDAKLVAARKNLAPTQQTIPVEENKSTTQSTEEPVKSTTAEAPKEEPKEQKPETPKEEKVEVDKPWDADEGEVTKPVSQEIDFETLGSALGFEGIKTKEDFVTKSSELKSKLKELEEKPLEGLPEEFSEVIKVAKRSGDWKEYLSQLTVDYSQINPLELYEDKFLRDAVKNPRYQTEGKYDHDKALAALDAIPETMREEWGRQMQYTMIQSQNQRKLELKQRAEQRAEQAEKALSQASRNLGELLPLETYGIKFEPKHSSEIYQGISSSKLTKKHLGLSFEDLVRSGADMKAVVRSITLAEKGEKMIAYKSNNSKTAAKKELLDTVQNVQLNSSTSKVTTEEPEQKVKSPAEKLREFKQSTKVGL